MDFKRFTQDTVERIDQELKRLLEEWRSEAGKTAASLLPLVDKFIKACQGGKRIRGTLVKLGYEMGKSTTDYRLPTTAEVGRQKSEDIIKIAAAYEIFHTAILAHDDIIDQSLERRGGPSLYQALGGNHYGISQAITLSDAGFFLAIKIISESKFEEKLKNQALRMFAKTMVDTAIGQMLDIQKGDPATIMRLKTAKYTVSGPLQIGTILAGGKQNLLDQLDKFGTYLGIAFQIKDDILDGEVESLDLAKAQAVKYMDKARKIIPKVTKDGGMIKLLEEMAEYLVQRTK